MSSLTHFRFNLPFFKNVWLLLKPYWVSTQKKTAIRYLILIVGCIVSEIYASIHLNAFNKSFFDALQNVDKATLLHLLPNYFFLLTLLVLSFGYALYFKGLLSVRWRLWLSEHYLTLWLSDQRYLTMQQQDTTADNPDQRLSEDLAKFPEMTLKLFSVLLHSILTLCAFNYILWQLSGTLVFHVFHHIMHLQGYLCWTAFIYAAMGSGLMYLLGKRLSLLQYVQERNNANYRYRLVQLRDNTESVALHGTEKKELDHFKILLECIYSNYVNLIQLQKKLAFFNNGYNTISYIFGLFIALPLFFAKKIQLGAIMQISGAFSTVVSSVSLFINSFNDLAEWQAVVQRLSEFRIQVEEINTSATSKTLTHDNLLLF